MPKPCKFTHFWHLFLCVFTHFWHLIKRLLPKNLGYNPPKNRVIAKIFFVVSNVTITFAAKNKFYGTQNYRQKKGDFAIRKHRKIRQGRISCCIWTATHRQDVSREGILQREIRLLCHRTTSSPALSKTNATAFTRSSMR